MEELGFNTVRQRRPGSDFQIHPACVGTNMTCLHTPFLVIPLKSPVLPWPAKHRNHGCSLSPALAFLPTCETTSPRASSPQVSQQHDLEVLTPERGPGSMSLLPEIRRWFSVCAEVLYPLHVSVHWLCPAPANLSEFLLAVKGPLNKNRCLDPFRNLI